MTSSAAPPPKFSWQLAASNPAPKQPKRKQKQKQKQKQPASKRKAAAQPEPGERANGGSRREHEDTELSVVALADAGSDPWAVVVKTLDTVVADVAMRRASRAEDLAGACTHRRQIQISMATVSE